MLLNLQSLVSINLQHLLLLGLLSATLHWLLARSLVARPLWSRLRGRAAALAECPACSGFWLGLVLGAGLGVLPAVVAMPWPWLGAAVSVLCSGVLAAWLTPVLQGVLLWGLAATAMGHEQEPAPGAVPEHAVEPDDPRASPDTADRPGA